MASRKNANFYLNFLLLDAENIAIFTGVYL